MRRSQCPVFLAPGTTQRFPDPRNADSDGLVAVGGDLGSPRLLDAYRSGIFPWFDDGMPALWWSPDPRAIIEPNQLHVSRSLRRRMRLGTFHCTLNRAFRDVMIACAQRPEGTWIGAEMVEAYTRLHAEGHAHSVEVWCNHALVGGLYGVQIGGLFAAESMFHRMTDASKVALVVATRSLFAAGTRLLDVQFLTPHLASMGARTIPRSTYLARAGDACRTPFDIAGLRGAFD